MASEATVYRWLDPKVFDSRDCVTRNCPNEAEAGETICRNCRVRPRPPDVSSFVRAKRRSGDRVYGDHRDLVDGTYGCKISGCDGRSYVRTGPYAYLCDEPHKREAVARGRRPKPRIS